MKFDYSNLKTASKEGTRLGTWKGKGVFACAKADLDSKGFGAYFIVYDDNNAFVSRSAKTSSWWKFGCVSTAGNVNEMSEPVVYTLPKAAAATTPTSGNQDEHICADFKMEMDMEKVLESARTMTIDDLLEGFNYGLEG